MTSGSFVKVQPSSGIEGVEIRAHDPFEIGGRIFRDVHEHIHRAFAKFLPRLNVRELLTRDVHRQERIKVEVGINADGVRGLLGDRVLCLRGE
jgi:hypothetical protein